MPYAIETIEPGVLLRLSGFVTVRHAQALGNLLAAALPSGAPVRVEAPELDDIDTSILQLLCSLRKTVPLLTFGELSAGFLAAVERGGLRREFADCWRGEQ